MTPARSIAPAMKPYLDSFEEVRHILDLVDGFVLLPIEVDGPEIAVGLAHHLTAEGKRVAIVRPDAREAAWTNIVSEILNAGEETSADVIIVIGTDNPPSAIHVGLGILNQARDKITRELQRPLLWCGPASFLQLTWGDAPDFWSIRMIDVHIEATVETTTSASPADEKPSAEIREHRAKWEGARAQGDVEISAYLGRKFVEALLEHQANDEASRIISDVLNDVKTRSKPDTIAEIQLLSARAQRARNDDMAAAATLGALLGRNDLGAYVRIRAQLELARLFEDGGHLDSAERAYQEALILARSISDAETEARALIGAYGIAARTGRTTEAEKPLEQAAGIARRLGNNELLASALAAQALLALGSFDAPQGARKLEEARNSLDKVPRKTYGDQDVTAVGPVDVLILTALQDELDAVLAVGPHGKNDWTELRDLGGFRYHRRELRRTHDSFVVAAAWIGEMGGRAAAIRAQQLLGELKPSCLAMCGICAGNRNKVNLGDIIVADRLFAWDEGKRIVESGKEQEFFHELRSFGLENVWRMDAAYLAREFDVTNIARTRPPAKETQKRWLLRAIEANESGKASPPAERPDRAEACPGYTGLLRQLIQDELVIRRGRTLVLTDKGRDWVDEDHLMYPDGTPEDPPLRVHVGAIATVSSVVEDSDIFARMQHVVRSTLGLEMEGMALGEVAHHFQKRAILIKAVQDFADGSKDDGFRLFACRASAEFLFAFLEKVFEPERSNQRDENQTDIWEETREFESEDPFLSRVEGIVKLRHEHAKITRHRTNPPFAGLLELDIDQGGFSETQLVAAIDAPMDAQLIREFATSIERPFRYRFPLLRSTIVHQGDAAPRDLRAEAFRQGIQLESFRSYQGLFDFGPYLEWQTNRLAHDPIYLPGMYVDPPATYEVSGSRDVTRVENALEHLWRLLDSPDQRRFALVIGEFGAGKTFLLRELARRMVVEKHPVWPVRVEMHHLEKQPDLSALLAAHFARADVPGYNFRAFQYLLNEGRIALLFDGFDELAGQVTYDTVTAHFKTILSAAHGERAKVVLSSRRQHFLSETQIKLALTEQAAKVPGFRLIMLEPFGELQIRQYLHNVLVDKQQADERYALIHDVKDLLGLSHNPRMLGFIARIPEASLREAKQRDGEITAAKLYELLVNDWLSFEHKRSRRISTRRGISREALDKGITVLALSMWHTRIKFVRLEELREIVDTAVRDLGESTLDPDVLTHLFGSGSLLVRDAEEQFSFVHRSVLEWFVAREVASEVCKTGDSAALMVDEMSPLMADFFHSMTGRDTAIRWALSKLEAQDAGFVAKNATVVLQRLGESLAKLDFAGHDLRGKDFTNVDWRGADLHGVNLEGATLVGANLEGANLEGARLYRANLTQANLTGAKLARADLQVARLVKADLTRTEGLDSVELFRTNWVGSKVEPGFDPALRDPAGASPRVTNVERMGSVNSAPCFSVAFDPQGELLAASYYDGSIRLFDAISGELLRICRRYGNWAGSMAFSGDGKAIAAGYDDGALRLWETYSGNLIHEWKGHTSAVLSLAFHPDGKALVSGSRDGTVYWLNLKRGTVERHVTLSNVGTRGIAFSPDSKVVATRAQGTLIRLWNTTSGYSLRSFGSAFFFRGSYVLFFSPDGNALAAADNDNTVVIWDAQAGAERVRLSGHTDIVNSIVFSPDGETLTSASDDNTLRVWQVRTGKVLHVLKGHTNTVRCVAQSPDGKTLASGSYDRTIRFWDVASGQCIGVLDSASGPWDVVGLCRFEVGEIQEIQRSPPSRT